MTLDDLNTAEELLTDPDSEDNERFASRYGRSLIELARQALRAAPAGPESLSVPQDAKSNPSNGLVERVARIVDPELFVSLDNQAGFPPESLERWQNKRTTEALSKAREIDALYQQQGVLSSQRGEKEQLSAEDDAYEIGKRDGYEEAVQRIDLLTGGDGEYRFCTDGDPDRHTPDAAAMMQRIVDRQREENRSANAISGPGLPGPDTEAVGSGVWQSGEAAPSEPLIERLAYEASVWSKDPAHNIGADQPSIVFARRFSFLLQRALRHD